MAILVERRGHVGHVMFDRPEKRNAVNLAMRKALVEAWTTVEQDPDVWVVKLSGAGGAFSAGHDLKEVVTAEQAATDPGIEVFRRFLSLSKPVVAQIDGACMGLGAGLAFLSDVRLASDSTRFGWPEAKIGIGSLGGPAILPRLIPKNIALEYLFTGELFTAADARRMGLVNHVTPAVELATVTDALIDKILANAPLAVRAMKSAATAAEDVSQLQALMAAEPVYRLTHHTEDATEGLASFRERRTPVWQGR